MKNCIIFGGNGFIGTHLAIGLRNKFNIFSFSNSDFTKKKKNK